MASIVKQFRDFIRLSGYYKRFIKNYASVAQPLTYLFQKDKFQWIELAHDTLVNLKNTMTLTPVLILPDFSQPSILETNGSRLC